MPHSIQRKRKALEGEMMECTMSLYRNKDDMISDMRAEITQIRAELAAERELADRMAGALEYIDDYCLAYPELESLSSVSSSAIEYVDTRRSK